MAVTSIDSSGFNSLFAASTRLAQQTVAANVSGQGERILKRANGSLKREVADLSTENKLLAKENQQLNKDNKQLSRDLSQVQAKNTQDLYEKNNLKASQQTKSSEYSAEKTMTGDAGVKSPDVSAAAIETVNYHANTASSSAKFFSANVPGSILEVSA